MKRKKIQSKDSSLTRKTVYSSSEERKVRVVESRASAPIFEEYDKVKAYLKLF